MQQINLIQSTDDAKENRSTWYSLKMQRVPQDATVYSQDATEKVCNNTAMKHKTEEK